MSEFQNFLENALKDILITDEKELALQKEYDINEDIQNLIVSAR